MLRFVTAGESHGPALTAIIDGLPAGLALDAEQIDRDLRRRQGGYGRGGRQRIERDHAEVTGGLVNGVTIGAPVAIQIANRDWENWRDRVVPPWRRPRPGHADLAGAIKYGLDDLRLVAERASARETAARVAMGAVCRALLAYVGVRLGSYVEAIGGVRAGLDDLPLDERLERALASDVSCPDPAAADAMRAAIDAARAAGDSLGGVVVAAALGVPVGLGSHAQWDRRLDGRLAQAVMSVQAVKGVEIGPAFENAALPGTRVHDALYPANVPGVGATGGSPRSANVPGVGATGGSPTPADESRVGATGGSPRSATEPGVGATGGSPRPADESRVGATGGSPRSATEPGVGTTGGSPRPADESRVGATGGSPRPADGFPVWATGRSPLRGVALVRRTNRAGGVEGGISNGAPIVVRAAMKPIPTTVSPQPTVDLDTGEAAETQYQRSDVCAVPAAAVVVEAMVAWVLADALLERYGGDHVDAILRRVRDDG